MESNKEYNNTAVVAVEIEDDMEAPSNHNNTNNNKDIKDHENLDVISDTVGETLLNTEDNSFVSTDLHTQNSSKSSSCFSRLCCCFNDCTKQKLLVIATHAFILIIAILCLIPTGVMKEVMRARMANIATLVWIIYCIMISINISYYFHRRKHMSKSSREEEVDVDMSKYDQEEVDVEDQTSNNYRVASTCNKMGCLCFRVVYIFHQVTHQSVVSKRLHVTKLLLHF